MKKRLLSIALVLVMLLSMLPTAALADSPMLFYVFEEPVGTYTFYGVPDGQADIQDPTLEVVEHAAQKLKAGETLQLPVPQELNHNVFTGWLVKGDDGSEAIIPAGTKDYTQPEITKDVAYTVTPQFRHVHYVVFMEKDEVDIGGGETKVIVYDTMPIVGNQVDLSAMTNYHPVAGSRLTGWQDKAGNVYPLGIMTVPEEYAHKDWVLYPVLETTGAVTFHYQDGKGTQSVIAKNDNGTVTKPADPTMRGYEFSHWSAEVDGAAFTFTDQAPSNLYAVWTPQMVNYTVVFWKENADDEGYTYADHIENLSATAGDVVEATAYASRYDAEDFYFNAEKTGVIVVEGDGSSILNVYYDREEFTLTFRTGSGNRPTCGKDAHTHRNSCYEREQICDHNMWWQHDNDCYEYVLSCGLEEHTHSSACYASGTYTITAKHGAAIYDKFQFGDYTNYAWEDESGRTYSYALQTLDRMPRADVSFELYNANEWPHRDKSTINYWVEAIPGASLAGETTTTRGGHTFILQKQVITGFNYATYNEEYHEIAGFSRLSAREAGFSGNQNSFNGSDTWDLYYYRNLYNLVYLSDGQQVRSEAYAYQESLSGAFDYVPEAPAGKENYTFAGWYISPIGEAGDEAAANLKTMPLDGAVVYAKWMPPTSTITAKYTYDATGNHVVTLVVEKGSTLTLSDLPSVAEMATALQKHYEDFLGWYDLSGAPFQSGIVNTDMVLYANWRQEFYIVNFDLGEGSWVENYERDNYAYVANDHAQLACGRMVEPPEGKAFDHWVDAAGNVYYPHDLVLVPAGGITLTAVYREHLVITPLQVTYEPGEAEGTPYTQEVDMNNDTFKVLENRFTAPAGKVFAGWLVEGSDPEWILQPNDVAHADTEGENVLIAQWEEVPVPELKNVNKTADKQLAQESVQVGDVITYTVTATSAAQYFSVTDAMLAKSENLSVKIDGADHAYTLSGDVLTVDLGAVPASEVTLTFTYQYTVTEADMDGETIVNKAEVTSWNDQDYKNDPEDPTVEIPVDEYDITGIIKTYIGSEDEVPAELKKYADDYAYPENGEILVGTGGVWLLYAITVTGEPGAAFTVEDTHAMLELGDDIIGDENVFEGVIPASGALTFYVVRQFYQEDIVDGKLTNVAVVKPGDHTEIPDTVDPEDEAEIPAAPTEVVVEKHAVTEAGVAGQQGVITGYVPVEPGDDAYKLEILPDTESVTLLYAVTAETNGSAQEVLTLRDSGAVYVDYAFEQGTEVTVEKIANDTVKVTFEGEGSVTVYFKKTFSGNRLKSGELTNSVEVNGKTDVPSDPVVVDEVEIDIAKSVTSNGDLKALKPGDVLTYTVTLTNKSDVDAADVQFTDVLTATDAEGNAVVRASQTFTVDSILAGQSAEVIYTYTVTEDDLGCKLKNTATVQGGTEPSDETEVEVPEYEITDFDKEVVRAEVPGLAVNAPVTYPAVGETLVVPAEGVTLLYKLTVTGDAGAEYKIEDEGAVCVSGELEGKIPAAGEAVVYVTKYFTAEDIVDGKLTNVAAVNEDKTDEEEIPAIPAVITVEKAPVTEPTVAGIAGYLPAVLENGAYTVKIPANTSSVTLLYAVTATTNGTTTQVLSLEDPGAEYAGYESDINVSVDEINPAEVEVTFPGAGSVTVYFKKTFTNPSGELLNTVIVNDDEEIPSDPVDVEKADITIDKAVEAESGDLDDLKPGDVLRYTVTLTNTTNVAASNVVFRDIMIATDAEGKQTFRLALEDVEGAVYNVGRFTVASVPANGQAVVTYTYTITEQDVGCKLTNTAVVQGGTNPSDKEEVEVPVYKITRFEKRMTATTGSRVELDQGSFVVTENGINIVYELKVIGDPGAAFTITDEGAFFRSSDEAGIDGLSGVIPADGDVIIEVVKHFEIADITNGMLSNVAYVRPDADNTEIDNPRDPADPYLEAGDVVPAVPVTAEVTKRPVTEATVAGVNASYIPVIKNGNVYELTVPEGAESVTLLYAVEVTANGEHLVRLEDAGAVYAGSQTANEYRVDRISDTTVEVVFFKSGTAVVYFTKTFDLTADEEQTLSNSVKVNNGDPIPGDDVEVETAEIGIEKTVSPIGTVKHGDVLTYTVTLTNDTDVDAVNVEFTDTLTAIDAQGVAHIRATKTFTVPVVPAGEDVEVTYTYTVTKDDAGCTLNNAVVIPDGDEDDTDVEVEELELYGVDKAVVTEKPDAWPTGMTEPADVTYPGAEKKVTFTGSAITLLYTLTVTGEPGAEYALTDDGAVVVFGDLTGVVPEGGEAVVYVTKTFYISDIENGKLINSVTVDGGDNSKEPDDPDDTEEVEADVKTGLSVLKKAWKVDGKDIRNYHVQVGQTVTWTIVVRNTGAADLTNVNVVDTLGIGRTEKNLEIVDENGNAVLPFALEAGKEVILYAHYKVVAADAGKVLSNHVLVTGKDIDDNPDNDPKAEDKNEEVRVSNPDLPGPALNKQDHVAYIIGYDDDTVRPEKNITRAEVATIFFRLLTDESRAYYWCQTNSFSDVELNHWFNNAVSTMANAGIVNGYPDGSFQPNEPITRAEFAAVAARFSDVIYNGESRFSDVLRTHWAFDEIALAEHLGWINGYPDNTFRPDKYITRAEAMTLINRVLERAVEEEHMLGDMITWVDNEPSDWFYEAVQEATNSHTYVRLKKIVPGQDFYYEDWIKILPPPDWAALEKAWSKANDH